MMKTEEATPFGIEDTVNSSQRGLTMESIFNDFAAETTAHGIPRIINCRKPLSKVFWLCLVVVALTIFFIQTTILLSNYYAFNTKINLINSEEVHFPAVTVCNLNKMKRSSLVSLIVILSSLCYLVEM
ncbi:Amiloride-sensitive sodium channel subunit alpha [Holothuria leucospilota]|uniref:Amiloride-sensitive sodium channel subunit alpha n=1 Tax=Holothuria leucospilota TaxID=206669 RepID=A0A9Q1H2T5_HOLLE|nr:Amiloride-sensitive sodium channel subunit alpha [Holothuria leucospilota]